MQLSPLKTLKVISFFNKSTVYQDILSTLMSITAETSLAIYGDDSDISKPSSKYK